MAEALQEADAPPVPGFWRLGWLLFMQPLTLHRLFAAWGLERNPSLWKLRSRLREGDPVVRALVARLAGWLAVAGGLALIVIPIDWGRVVVSVLRGVDVAIDRGVVVDTILGVAGGSVFAFALSIFFSVIGLYAGNIAIDAPLGIISGIAIGIGAGVASAVGFGVARGFAGSVGFGVAAGVASTVTFLLTYFRLPLYPAELTFIAALRLIARFRPASLPRLASYLPYRHHDLICLPLPFLAGLLVRLGEEHQVEGRRALAEAVASPGQKRPARRALVELQARSLERAAREKRYASAASLALPFLPGRLWPPQSGYLATVDSIAAAAQDLEAARSTGSHHQRHQALTRARKELERTLDILTSMPHLSRENRRFLPVIKAWLDRVADDEEALAALERKSPQVPLVFVAGVPLTPADESLFVGRTDLVRLLDQDLAAERPVPLVLLGQRRMGKSTLLNFLPRLLGTGARVISLNFQGLSGHSLKGEPHRWVAAEVAAALACEPPQEPAWGATLDWLSTFEEPLAASGRRLLIALDEVEGLERGIKEGWSDPAFLDFLRAAGDRLRRIRFLLVTAHPFSRLGPHWSDRLISAQTRRIEPLAEEEARALLTQPVPGFPDIYPPGGVERLLAATACHPYLLQLTAYDLTRRLNDAGRLKATDDDLTAALDRALEENTLFQNLWDDLTATEQRLIAALARGDEQMAAAGANEVSQARRDLAREQLIRQDGEGWRVAVPLFARWIREIGSAG